MQRPDDELDNLFRHHLAGQIDPVRGQNSGRPAGRSIAK